MAHVSDSPGDSPPEMKSPPPTIIIPTAVGTMEAMVAITLDFTGRVYHDGDWGVKSYNSHLEMKLSTQAYNSLTLQHLEVLKTSWMGMTRERHPPN